MLGLPLPLTALLHAVVPLNTVPTRRFGRTEIKMPVFTMGGMRMQQTWKPSANFSMSDVDPECQANFVTILESAVSHGINHFETARGYGCSELQYGAALRELLASGHQRSELIIQSKVAPFATQAEFRKTLDTTLSTLGVDYLDLFTFHGLNNERQLRWTLRKGGCMCVEQTAPRVCFAHFPVICRLPLVMLVSRQGGRT
jgi:predicted aldo/keto reductase-like oxidoreductase|eukprot:SAG25_NODE_601_length_6632_cov_6.861319_1_plen_200_part_00